MATGPYKEVDQILLNVYYSSADNFTYTSTTSTYGWVYTTKDFRFESRGKAEKDQLINERQLRGVYVKLANASTVTVKYKFDGADTYSTLATITTTTPSGKTYHYQRLNQPQNNLFKSVGLQFSGTGYFKLYEVHFDIDGHSDAQLRAI